MLDDNPYEFWENALIGLKPEMNPENPRAGFYRMERKDQYGGQKIYRGVAYWPDEESGELCCALDGEDISPERGVELWVSAGANPVSEDWYRRWEETGRWPDEHEIVHLSLSNFPPDDDSYEGLRDAIMTLAEEAKRRLNEGKPIESQEEASQIADLAKRMAALGKRADKQRKDERRPYDILAADIQLKWANLIFDANKHLELKQQLLTPWLSKQIEAGQPAQIATRERSMSLRESRKARIVDYELALNHFKNENLIVGAVQQLADRAVKDHQDIPGVEVVFTQRVQ
jgi:hypothetical protein